MLPGIIAYAQRLPKFLVRLIDFIPILLTATYLVFITAIVLPLAVALCIVIVPLLYVLWRAKANRFHPVFLRIMLPFELIGLTIVNSPRLVAIIVDNTRKIKMMKPSTLRPVKMNHSKAMLITLRVLAVLGVIGVAAYLAVVAAVVVPLALGCCLVAAPFCYLLWYIRERKFVPLFQKIPVYLEHLGFTIVNSRKIMTKMVVGFKFFKFPMF
jgi:hypothetical protein